MKKTADPSAATTQNTNERLTQKAVAARLGLSPSVVSLVMKNPDTTRASDETKRRILEVLKKNTEQRSYIREGADTLLVINKPGHDVYFYQSAMLYGIQSRAGELGLKTHIASPSQDLRSYLFGSPLRGVLVTHTDLVTEQVRELAGTTRVVTVNPQEHGRFIGDAVFPDYYTGMSLAVAHLLERGHQRIGYIGEQPDEADSRARERLLDFHEACDALGVSLLEEDIHLYPRGTDTDDAGGRVAAERLLTRWKRLKHRPTAFMLFNDNLAMKVYQTARDLGIRIPSDLSLIGFDNEPVCEQMHPKLTSVSPEFFNVGRMAVDLLTAEKAETSGLKMICPVKLMVRESVSKQFGKRK
jgi:DNA-binding LacI/PurR family transcriptional regulator